ncbi:hypothetical protein TrLO_g3771 [Triparma laevis f. longispina]|uniref:Uncharacterized protein n=1 Tax=Triparma laevis f. longispina TaxID=1714387 RepID=A0A9W7FR38_9STRA|nr:hypothetical protein TrLO_g3771 [Triparma laevis f. longispina]
MSKASFKLPSLPAVKLNLPIDADYREKLMGAARRVSSSLPRKASLKQSFQSMATSASAMESGFGVRKFIEKNRPKVGITEYYARKRENHALAIELWAKHASPILKGEQEAVSAKDVMAPNHLSVEKGGDAGAEAAELMSKMSASEKLEYREEQKAKKNAEKRAAKEEKAEERRRKKAEKEHRQEQKAHEKAIAKDRLDEKAAASQLKKKLDKTNLSPKDQKMAKYLAKGTKKLAKRLQLEAKYGSGKITKQGNDDTTYRKKVDHIIPKIPGQQVGFTEGVNNIMGVYIGSEQTAEERHTRHDHHRDEEERKGRAQEAKIIEKAARRKAEKEKKARTKANNGVDPEEVEERARKHHHKHHHHQTKHEDDLNSEYSDSDSQYDSDSDSDGSIDIDDVFQPTSEFTQTAIDANMEAEMIAAEFKRQSVETKMMLRKMGYSMSTKMCTSCGGRTPARPIDFWTGQPKGGKANQWYAIGNQHFCYPCANNSVLMMGVAKALAVMNGLDAREGIKNWNEVKKMQFHMNYDVEKSYEDNKSNLTVVVDTGPTIEEIKEKQRKKDIRSQLRQQRLKKEKALKHPKKSQWWQKKRRKEENYWHLTEISQAGKKFERRKDNNAVNRKTPKIMGADWETYKEWFPQDDMRYQPR